MSKKSTNNIFSAQYPSGIAFLGSIVTGVAAGILQDNIRVYVMLGVGIGLILVGVISASSNNKNLRR